MKAPKLLTIFVTCLMSICIDAPKIEYIKIEYKGSNNKPIPTTVFYVDDSFDTTSLKYGKAFKVTEGEFSSIERTIKRNKALFPLSKGRHFFNITVVHGRDKSLFATKDKNSSEIVLNDIISVFSDSRRIAVKNILDDVMRRF